MHRSMVCRALALALAVGLVSIPGVVHADNGDFSNSALHARKAVSGQLPLEHPRLLRPAGLDPAHPEQIHISLAGPGAIAFNWVTPLPKSAMFHGVLQRLSRSFSLFSVPLGRVHCDGRSIVQYGFQPGNLVHTAMGDQPTCYAVGSYQSGTLHQVILDAKNTGVKLPPRTSVYYRVSGAAEGLWSEELSFTTPPDTGAASLPYRLGVVGDLGQTADSVETLAHLTVSSPESVILVGDLSYADGDHERWDSWGRLVAPHAAETVWMFTEGNHEKERARGVPDWLAYTSRFHIPSAAAASSSPLYYSYDIAGAHIVMLGSYADSSKSSAQAAWLEADLAGVDRDVTPWVVVSMHAPFYSSNYAHLGEAEPMRRALERVLYRHRVDVVFAGHVHAYERSMPVYDRRLNSCAPVYINIGDGGNREGPDTRWLSRPQWSAWREPSFGHGTLDFFNTTHAEWRWRRNVDSLASNPDADSTLLVRRDSCAEASAAL